MTRTRLRSDQGQDSEFLTEQEGSEFFIFREGYGVNDTNILLEDGYTLTIDSYQVYPLTISETIGNTEINSVKELEFNDSYGVNLVDQGNGKVRIDFGFDGQFTPVVKLGTTAQSLIYGVGYYSKFGKSTTISISVQFSKSGTGDLSIEGLPFMSANIANLFQMFSVNTTGLGSGATYGTGLYYGASSTKSEVLGKVSPNTSVIYFVRGDSAEFITDTSLGTSTTLNISGTYIASS